MSETSIIQTINVDNIFIRELISQYDIIKTFKYMKNIFGNEMNMKIKDDVLRLMVWQLTHSLDKLEELSTKEFSNISNIRHFAQTTEDVTLKAIANHIVCGMGDFKKYIDT